MYGRRSQAAGFDILAKAMIVARMASQRKIISTKAAPGLCKPKKIIDQSVLSTSCKKNKNTAHCQTRTIRLFARIREWLFQITKSEMPMSAKSVVQTGPNTHAGGLSAGRARVAYQPAMEGVVKSAPTIPAASDTAIAITSLRKLLIFIIFRLLITH